MSRGLWDCGIDGEPVVIPGADKGRRGDFCPAERYGLGCTRPIGHPGRHLASEGGDRVVGAWPGTHPPTIADLGGES